MFYIQFRFETECKTQASTSIDFYKKHTSPMKKILLNTILLLLGLASTAMAQNEKKEVAQIQPTIMVIPFAKVNEDLRTVLDSSVTRRVAIIKTQEAFDNRGYTTVDFRAKANATKVDAAFNSLSQNDLKSRLVEGSGADIYVEIEADEQRSPSGNSVRLNLIAYDAFTGRLLGSKTSESGLFRTEQFDKLVERALNKTEKDGQVLMLEDFLNVMQQKFDDIVQNGRAVKVSFTLDPNSAYSFETEIGNSGDELSDVIEDWFEKNAYKGNYHLQGSVGRELIYDEVRIPLRDETNKNFTPNKFARQIRKFCNSIVPADDPSAKLKVSDDIRGGTIYITLK